MQLFKSLIILSVCFSFIFSNASHIIFEDNDSIEITVLEQSENYVIIQYKIND